MSVNPGQTVLQRHNGDQGSAEMFISQTSRVLGNRVAPIDMNSFITYAVSTTLNSSVLLIAKGLPSMFTRGSYSADPGNPWLIFQHAQENQALAQHIQERWDNMVIHPDGDRNEVNKIAAHVLYQKVDDKWSFVPLPVANEKNVVRFEIDGIVIWSHPPRDKALMKVLKEDKQFTQANGDLKRFCENRTAILNKANIPEKKRVDSLEKQRGKIRKKFLEMYSFYENLAGNNGLPNSYAWPTLQLGSTTADGRLQRYGDTFSGVYGTYTNEVHHIFHASGVEARPLPTKKAVYDLFTSSLEEFNLSFDEVMRD